MSEQRRLRIAGLHHVTVLCRDCQRSADFYRNVLGMRLVRQTVSDDDDSARHLFFGDERGRPGTLITCLEYPQLDEGRPGPGAAHHFALAVDSVEELAAWRDYLGSRGIACTEVMQRGPYSSVYLRDPDGHIVELAAGAGELAAEE